MYRQSHSSSSSSFVLLSPPTTFSYHISLQIFEIILTLIETILNPCLKEKKKKIKSVHLPSFEGKEKSLRKSKKRGRDKGEEGEEVSFGSCG